MMKRLLIAGAVLMCLSGCSVPKYMNPPETITQDDVVTISDEHSEFDFVIKDLRYPSASRARISLENRAEITTREIQVREIAYDSVYTAKQTGPDLYRRGILYVDPSKSVDDLRRPITEEFENGAVGGMVIYSQGSFRRSRYGNAVHIKRAFCPTTKGACGVFDPAPWIKAQPTKPGYYPMQNNNPFTRKLEQGQIGNLEELRQALFEYNLDEELFPITEKVVNKTGAAFAQLYKVQGAPSWLAVEKGKHDMQFVIQNPMFAFDPGVFASRVNKKYAGLVKNFVDRERLELQLRLGGMDAVHPVTLTYYDARRLVSRIKYLESLGYGYVRLTANMKDVDVYVDNEKVGRISGKPFVTKLVEGTHRIQVRKDFFGSKTIKVRLDADDAFAYHFELKESGNLAEEMGAGKIVQSTGELVVVTTRNDLAVEIGGVKRVPPFKLPSIASGMHKMRVRGPGINTILMVTVNENGKAIVDLDQALEP